jgi:hypothetical protein
MAKGKRRNTQMLMLIWRLLTTVPRKLDQIIGLLQEIKALLEAPGPAVRLIFSAEQDGQIIEGVTQVNLRDDQKVTLTIKPVDKKGNPALLDGAPVWATSNSELATVTEAPDGLSAEVVAVGPLGTVTISVTADADLGSGVTPLAGSLDITVVSGAAETIEISAGDPSDQ